MGGQASAIQEQCQRKAESIKDELYRRVNVFRRAYQSQFSSISEKKKHIIKQATAAKLSELMDKGEITSFEATLTFIERASTIGIRNNYVMDEMFEQAVAKAKECDRVRKENPKKRCWRYGDTKENTFPPFFGVPISLKDSILYPGKISYIGHVDPVNPVPEEPCQFIILTEKMGFIPFVRSTTPQANKTFQTNNNIFGYAKNPWDETRTCGGSSGGEGGLVASHCSPIGVGSDIAGSLRMPSQFCGLVTLKPYYRYSNLCNASSGRFSGGLFLRPETGVMTRSVEDIIIWSQFMYDKENYSDIPRRLKDPYLRLQPFRQRVFDEKKRYKIGYLTDFKGDLKCSPSHRRAVFQSLKIAEKLGHYTEQIQIKHAEKMALMITRIWFASPNLQIVNELRKGEKPIPEYQQAFKYAKVPFWMKKAVASVLSVTQPRLAALVKCTFPYSIKQYFHFIYQLDQIRKELYQYLRSKEIDLIICPGFFMPAFKLGQANQFSFCTTFAVIWSILYYPAGIVPITTVEADEQYFEDYYKDQLNQVCNQSMKGSEGLPVGIHVVSYPGHEEEVLDLMKQIEDEVKFGSKHKSKTFDLIE